MLRLKSLSEIQYLHIPIKESFFSPIIPPESITFPVIDFIKYCPKDLLQLVSSVNYYELLVVNSSNNPYDYNVIYDSDFISFHSKHLNRNKVTLFILDFLSKHFTEIITYLDSIKGPLHYYLILNNNSTNNAPILDNTVENPIEFISLIIENQKLIASILNKPILSLNAAVDVEYKSLINFPYFVPARNNFFIINSIIGNFADSKDSNLSEELQKQLLIKESGFADKKQNTFDRQNLFLDQIKNIDFFIHIGYKTKLFKLVSNEAILSPLIITAPFNNPDIKEIYSLPDDDQTKHFLSIIGTEQTENYVSNGMNKENLVQSANYLKRIISYIDDISFLHASFFYSPIIRLPLKGKSIYRELSFFRTSTFQLHRSIKFINKIERLIDNFSNLYKTHAISTKLVDLIKSRNGQIILISDLPLGWLKLDRVPLAFSHDICRIPMMPFNSQMAIFTYNNNLEFVIPSNIISKTLVIFGSNEPEFVSWQDLCVELSKKLGFFTARCNNIEDVKKVINQYDPDFIIFDCHGEYDKTTHSTSLVIGDEFLTPNEIAKHNIVAPLVFISACGTAPTYGIINTVAAAFFQNGALSVTSTYLPIDIDASSILYLRLLNNLSIAASEGIHKNWLEFISHILRSSYVAEKFNLAGKGQSKKHKKRLIKLHVKILANLLNINKRRNIYLNIDNLIKNAINTKNNLKVDVIPEYLFYSNMGRSDLIKFEVWKNEFMKIHNDNMI